MKFLQRFDPRKSLTVRIIMVNLALILLALGSLVLWTGYRLQKSIIENAESELEVRSLIVANGLREPIQQQLAYEEAYKEKGGDDHEDDHEDDEKDGEGVYDNGDHELVFAPIGDRDFKEVVDSYANEMNARVTILDPNLDVRYSSDPNVPVHIEDSHPEILAALQQTENHDVRYDEWTDEIRLFVAAPILGNEGIEGIVQLSIPMDEISEQVRSTWLTLITAALALTVLFIAASIVLGEQITRPLHRLTAAAHRLAEGDLSTRLDMNRQDELGTLAAAFDHMAEEISQLLARERAFVANASHELRSPVTSIQLRAELLQMASLNEERRQRYIREIRQESEQLGHLIQQLLDLDRVQSAPPAVGEPMDPAPCLRKVFALMQPLGEAAGLTMHASIPTTLPAIRMDEKSCEIVMRNLLDNAIKYTPAGGEVHLEARATEKGVEIAVRDSGIGIPEQELPLVFERFYRVDKARDRTGSGLGLALVRDLLAQFGGDIRARSKEGEGTEMIVHFPTAS